MQHYKVLKDGFVQEAKPVAIGKVVHLNPKSGMALSGVRYKLLKACKAPEPPEGGEAPELKLEDLPDKAQEIIRFASEANDKLVEENRALTEEVAAAKADATAAEADATAAEADAVKAEEALKGAQASLKESDAALKKAKADNTKLSKELAAAKTGKG